MRWKTGRRSRNIEDRRGARSSFPGMPRVGGRRGLKRGGGLSGGVILIIIVIGLLTGQNPLQMLGMITGGSGSSYPTIESSGVPLNPSANDLEADFVSAVLADTEDTWHSLFAQAGSNYQAPQLVLYNDVTRTACGLGQAASGPFYCPADSKVYLDLGFFNELKRLGAPGDFAIAYVIAHEIGHHIQNLVGTSSKVYQQRKRSSKKDGNALSVLQELQADCYAGIWAHHAQRERNILEAGDIEEGLTAAASVGDDRLQRQAGRAVQPEAFTHGTSKQRMNWFQVGFKYGSVDRCNTFK
ncbi:MAG: neutral zinc metallopeptidase [Gammaproteobacteria bacterium]|nr:neutral zinc metallopeptidase [Gammaproteobacteria bacterium]